MRSIHSVTSTRSSNRLDGNISLRYLRHAQSNGSIDIVYSRNMLDHTHNADRVLHEIVRVLRPRGELLLNCDLRGDLGGGEAHPYKWNLNTFEAIIFEAFEPINTVSLIDTEKTTVRREEYQSKDLLAWVGRLRKR